MADPKLQFDPKEAFVEGTNLVTVDNFVKFSGPVDETTPAMTVDDFVKAGFVDGDIGEIFEGKLYGPNAPLLCQLIRELQYMNGRDSTRTRR